MKFSKVMIAAGALCAAMAANATVTGSLGGGAGTFLDLSSSGLSMGGSTVATLTGGAVYNAQQPFADIPGTGIGSVYGGNFLSAGVGSGTVPTATLSFAGAGVDYISFLWGSPDSFNLLTVNSSVGPAQTFTTASLGFLLSNGDQNFSQYVQFSGLAGAKITSLTFSNTTTDYGFETANYSVTAPVPEPETYALLLAGLGAVGFVARRRKS